MRVYLYISEAPLTAFILFLIYYKFLLFKILYYIFGETHSSAPVFRKFYARFYLACNAYKFGLSGATLPLRESTIVLVWPFIAGSLISKWDSEFAGYKSSFPLV